MGSTGQQTAFKVRSDRVTYTDSHVISKYDYSTTRIVRTDAGIEAIPTVHDIALRTDLKVPRLGCVSS